jgi:hypothetical protein
MAGEMADRMKMGMRSQGAFCVISCAAFLCAVNAKAQVTVFTDNYNRSALSPAPNGASYTVTATGDGGASIASNVLALTNDASAAANANGSVSVAIPTTSFASPYDPVLSLDGVVTWNFNMQQVRTDPSGFGGGSYGAAFILAGSASNFTTGNGYAITLGGSGAADPVRLVSYTGGIANQTAIVTPSSGAFADVGSEYLSVRVTYVSATNTWALLGRVDGTTSFNDPTTGTLTSFGTAVNSTYTNIALNNLGEFWNFNTAASQIAQFDNVSVVVPEPNTWAAGALAVAGLLLSQRRRIRRLLRA